uniref:Uncharacterized protein n=1 Tax=Picea glauca TaxID=3330 RepID=A0A101M4I9_PICGL|nr:hypothetical protein ABT39_MTgene529 [Picea glauca]QHR89414.1 hypothetical protein Q903MT_gene3435 [Picea sitchensis]
MDSFSSGVEKATFRLECVIMAGRTERLSRRVHISSVMESRLRFGPSAYVSNSTDRLDEPTCFSV